MKKVEITISRNKTFGSPEEEYFNYTIEVWDPTNIFEIVDKAREIKELKEDTSYLYVSHKELKEVNND